MCGIAGTVFHRPTDISGPLGRRMQHTLAHRGPDDLGYMVFDGEEVTLGREWPEVGGRGQVLLVHRRLSIIDLAKTGWQPMSTPDGRYHMVYNGEIYNYIELQAELEALGYRFDSHSDTQVLLAAYAEWGEKSLQRLVGMFAFAILDTWKRTLFLARDFFGIKPLFYAVPRDGFAFASEIKALLDVPGVTREPNPHRVYEYLRTGFTDHGAATMYAHVHQLEPGHFVEISLDQPGVVRPVRYWQLRTDQTVELSFDEAAAHLRDLFLESVSLHLRSDVPIGAALSGGVDSSAIVSAMRLLKPNLDIHTFSYVADDPLLGEERWVDIVGGSVEAVVHKTRLLPEDLAADLDHLISAQDEPFGSTSIYAQHRVFRLAQEAGIKVMLDGQGADELLAGYSSYYVPRLASLLRRGQVVRAGSFVHSLGLMPRVPSMAILRSAALRVLPEAAEGRVRSAIKRNVSPKWLNGGWFAERDAGTLSFQHLSNRQGLREQLALSVRETLPSLLRYEDRNSMAHSIESRVPFLTPQLAEFILSLPEEYVITADATTKSVFRRAMQGIVPSAILQRRDKVGFETPENRWFADLRPWVESALAGAAAIPALDSSAIQKEWGTVLQCRPPFDSRIWRWINLIRWSEINKVDWGDIPHRGGAYTV